MKQSERTSKPASNSRALLLSGVCLAFGAAISVLLMINAVHKEAGELILWLGWLSITFIFASSICLFSGLAAFFGHRRRSETLPHKVATDSEYVARYSRSDRAKALFIVVLFGASTAFLRLRSAKLGMISFPGALFVWAVFYAVHIMTTRITFTHHGFVARLSWFRKLNEPYGNVQLISGKPGTLKIQFSDGCVLKFHSGLGDPDAVIAHLQARCPESIHLE